MSERKKNLVFLGLNGILYVDAVRERLRELQAKKRENEELHEKIEADIAELKGLLGRVKSAIDE